MKYPIYHVQIKRCSNLQRIEVARKISSHCKELLELSGFNQIGTLQTNSCSKLLSENMTA
jgi:hypothetical protein